MKVRTVLNSLPLSSLTLLTLCCSPAGALGDDWPNLLGPDRDGQAAGEALLETWPEGGPTLLWESEAGEGYAGPAVANGQVLLFHRVGDFERLESIHAANGKQRWQHDLEVDYRSRIDPDAGPRAVPLVNGDFVYTLGVGGRLRANNLETGELVWTRDIAADFEAPEGYFGFGCSPIFSGGLLLLNTGGERAGLAAFEPKTGATSWTLGQDAASYSAPIEAVVDGEPVALFVTRTSVVGVKPATGRELFRFPFGKRGPTVNAASPVLVGEHFFVTASYGVGGKLFDVSEGKVRTLWSGDESLSSHYVTPVLYGDYLYGPHGRDDLGNATYRSVNAMTGKVAWSRPDIGTAFTIIADERALIVSKDGTLRIASLGPDALTVHAQSRATTDLLRAAPALANGVLYVKTSSRRGKGKLLAILVGARK